MFCALTLAAFAAVMTPWIIRNYEVSGLPFGTATCAVVEGTELFPGDKLERSLDPDVRFLVEPIRAKLFANLRSIAQTGLFSLGGGWIISFFLVGLMVSFRNPAVRRMRYFLLMSLGVLAVAQALGRTQQSADSPEINSENLLVLLAPLVAVYAVSLFLLLLDQVNVQTREVRYTLTTLFGALCVLPLIIALLPPRTPPVAYPPYHPQVIQQNAALLREDEWMMSDVPWAVAWYGRRPCAWLTLQARPDAKDPAARENFVSFNQRQKTISALYLTPKTLNGTFASEISADGNGWGNFIVQTLARQAPPPDFPLPELREGYLPEQLFVADRKRW